MRLKLPFKWTLPNILTISRLAAVPLFLFVYYLPFEYSHFVVAGILLLAALTDWLDGYLARKLQQTSSFGAFLDPVADKLIVVVALVVLVEQNSAWYYSIPIAIIICREVLVSALREWMAEMQLRSAVAVAFVGKLKTTMQLIALIVLLAFPAKSGFFCWLGLGLLYIATVLTIWSMVGYIQGAMRSLRMQ